MTRIYLFFIMVIPAAVFGQVTISGKILNNADNKPIAGAAVFLNNTSIGTTTTADGNFIIRKVKPGTYQLVVKMVGFDPYSQAITITNTDLKLPDITLLPKTTELNQVTITYHRDPNREKYLEWFKQQFLGSSDRAQDCRLLNPDMLDLAYDETSKTLTASSVDFLEIENGALGYKIKYLLKNFSFENGEKQKVYYEGPVLFEELEGSAGQHRRWERNRLQAYQNSPMHFYRAVLANRLDQENFRVLLYAIYRNPERPADSVINAKIAYYQTKGRHVSDSLAYWQKKLKLPVIIKKLMPEVLHKKDLVQPASKPGEYALTGEKGSIYVSWSDTHRFHIDDQVEYLYNTSNNEKTLINFNQPEAIFNQDGVLLNPYAVEYFGVWGRLRVADMLPIDYEPPGADAGQPPFFKADSTLAGYLQDHIAEKAYLQFDKPYYAAGDTIYFKAYVTAGLQHRLSAISGLLHADLIDPAGKVTQSIKLKIDSGITWGDFALPDSGRNGSYRVRAYTQWMRNSGDDAFFEKELQVVSAKAVKIPESLVKTPSSKLKADIQFMPEGGDLVAGINSVVAFKAIGSHGLGVNINGEIVDDRGARVASFVSSHLGMGNFSFTPQAGKTYSAKISYTDGKQDIIPLPKPQADGITLSVDNDELPKATVTIKASDAFFKQNKGRDYRLLISSGGLITTVDRELDSAAMHIDILKRRLRTGIATITLFSPDSEPLAERLFFVQNYDALSLNLKSDKDSYTEREKTHISLNALNRRGDGTAGHFSVSVVNENIVPDAGNNEDNILSYLLLTSDLKGNAEQPGYYFADTSTMARKNLDLLMLTQGYRRFEWKKVLDTAKQSLTYQPENGIAIAGHVYNTLNKPVAYGTVTLIPSKGGPLLTTQTDENGRFSFSGLNFTDTIRCVLNATNEKGSNLTKIVLEKETYPAVSMVASKDITQRDSLALAGYAGNEKVELKQVANYVNQKAIMLKQVNVRDKKPDNEYHTESLAGAGQADQVMHAKEIEEIQGPLVTSLNGRLRGVVFVGPGLASKTPYLNVNLYGGLGGNKPKPMLIVLDGTYVSPDELTSLDANAVETVEVLKYASASMYGVDGGGGVLVITTKRTRQLSPREIQAVGVLPVNRIGFYKARKFYSPQYDGSSKTAQRDLRSTIFWQPELKTDKDGNAEFEYYNADLPGTYKITIEGIDKDGNIGRQVYRYEVK